VRAGLSKDVVKTPQIRLRIQGKTDPDRLESLLTFITKEAQIEQLAGGNPHLEI
jgi:hypothetical protein